MTSKEKKKKIAVIAAVVYYRNMLEDNNNVVPNNLKWGKVGLKMIMSGQELVQLKSGNVKI